MTLILGLVALGLLAVIWERLDTIREELTDLVWLVEQHAPPPRDPEGRARRDHRRGSRD